MLVSIVHDFAVLYSSRVHQKLKKWSDGRLKYYELNRKIEVLSDEGFLVSSDFYPHSALPPLETGVFAEGSTYALPSNRLMVEFVEYVGCSERDISKLYQKHKKGETLVVPERPIKIEVKQEKTTELAGDVAKMRLPRVGLRRPKRPSRQVEVTRFVKKMTVEERLELLQNRNPSKTTRVLPGTNRQCIRLYRELGISSELGINSELHPVHGHREVGGDQEIGEQRIERGSRGNSKEKQKSISLDFSEPIHSNCQVDSGSRVDSRGRRIDNENLTHTHQDHRDNEVPESPGRGSENLTIDVDDRRRGTHDPRHVNAIKTSVCDDRSQLNIPESEIRAATPNTSLHHSALVSPSGPDPNINSGDELSDSEDDDDFMELVRLLRHQQTEPNTA